MTRKGLLAIILFLMIFLCVICFSSAAVNDPILGTLAAIILSATLSVGAIIFAPFRTRLQDFVQKNIRPQSNQCRIFVFGLSRSGKTTMIRRLLTEDKPKSERSTDDFDVYDDNVRLGLQDPKWYSVGFTDYKGQKQSQVLQYPPEKFFGPPGNRLINVIFFVVDLFPVKDDKGHVFLDDQELIGFCRLNAENIIQSRVQKNLDYITEHTIELVFEAAYSKQNLFAIRLLVNKSDVLEEIISRGYIPDKNFKDMEKYALNLYAVLEENIKEACKINHVKDFSTHLISAKKGEGVADVFSEILETYTRGR